MLVMLSNRKTNGRSHVLRGRTYRLIYPKDNGSQGVTNGSLRRRTSYSTPGTSNYRVIGRPVRRIRGFLRSKCSSMLEYMFSGSDHTTRRRQHNRC